MTFDDHHANGKRHDSDIFDADAQPAKVCGSCGQPEGECYNLCPNSPAYYSPERERQDDMMDDGSDDHRERYAATAEPSQYEEPEEDELGGNTSSLKQLNYIRDLLDKKQIDAEAADGIRQQIAEGKVDGPRASRYLDKLIALPKRQREVLGQTAAGRSGADRKELPVGMYRTDSGQIIRVYLGQKSGVNLVKVYDEETHTYEYAGSATGKAYHLCAEATKMTLAEAKEFGKMSGHCCVCARRLDVPESVEAGIGPVCASRFDS